MVNQMKRQNSFGGFSDKHEEGADTRPWTPVPLRRFGTYTGQRISNGLQVMPEDVDTSAFWGGSDESNVQTVRGAESASGRGVCSVAASAADGTGSSVSQQVAREGTSKGDTDAMTTLRMYESTHGPSRGGRLNSGNESPSGDQDER